jgi:hypothetical protein
MRRVSRGLERLVLVTNLSTIRALDNFDELINRAFQPTPPLPEAGPPLPSTSFSADHKYSPPPSSKKLPPTSALNHLSYSVKETLTIDHTVLTMSQLNSPIRAFVQYPHTPPRGHALCRLEKLIRGVKV